MKKAFTLKQVDEMKFSKYITVKAIVLYIAVLCLGAFSVLIFVKGVKATKEYDYTYTENNNIDYKVYLKENEFFEDEYLEKGTEYIASLIDKIDVNFDYELDSEDIVNGDYSYYVTATLEAKEKGKDVIIWSKEETIFDNVTQEFKDQNNFKVSPNVSVNYEKYNSIMTEFKNAYGVSLDASLVITMHMTTNITHENMEKSITTPSESSIRIPLLEQTIEIEQNYVNTNSIINTITYKSRTYWHFVLCTCGIILFILYLHFSVRVLKLIFTIREHQNKYQARLKRILSNYDQVIVKVKALPDVKKKEILELDNFNDLLDAQTELREPILFNETLQNQESSFMIIKDNRVFRYIMKYTDFL